MGCAETKRPAPQPRMMFPVESEGDDGSRSVRTTIAVSRAGETCKTVKGKGWVPWHKSHKPSLMMSRAGSSECMQTDIGGNVKAAVYVEKHAWVMPMPADQQSDRSLKETPGGGRRSNRSLKETPGGGRRSDRSLKEIPGGGNREKVRVEVSGGPYGPPRAASVRRRKDSPYVSSSADSVISRHGKQNVDISRHSNFKEAGRGGCGVIAPHHDHIAEESSSSNDSPAQIKPKNPEEERQRLLALKEAVDSQLKELEKPEEEVNVEKTDKNNSIVVMRVKTSFEALPNVETVNDQKRLVEEQMRPIYKELQRSREELDRLSQIQQKQDEMQRQSIAQEQQHVPSEKSFVPPPSPKHHHHVEDSGAPPGEGWDRLVECPDLKCDKILPLKHLLDHIHHKHPFALWIGTIEENFISRQYWNIKSYVNFEKDSNTWVLTIWDYDGHTFIATFTRLHGSWYSWVYICSTPQEADRYIVEVRIVNERRGSGVSYTGRVHAIDERGEDIRNESDCFVLTDEVVKKYMTSDGLSDARRKEGYDYRIPIEYKIFKK